MTDFLYHLYLKLTSEARTVGKPAELWVIESYIPGEWKPVSGGSSTDKKVALKGCVDVSHFTPGVEYRVSRYIRAAALEASKP